MPAGLETWNWELGLADQSFVVIPIPLDCDGAVEISWEQEGKVRIHRYRVRLGWDTDLLHWSGTRGSFAGRDGTPNPGECEQSQSAEPRPQAERS